MDKTAPSERREPESFSETGVIQLFPFMPEPSWYRKYWCEREPGRIGKVVSRLFRIPASALLLRMPAKAFRTRPQPDRRADSLTLRT